MKLRTVVVEIECPACKGDGIVKLYNAWPPGSQTITCVTCGGRKVTQTSMLLQDFMALVRADLAGR